MLLYGLTIAVSAFLLFLVQPVIARQILPWFGGSAAVWTTCMVFFQVTLLAGYFYADFLIRRFQPKRQAQIHTVLLALSLALLPITADPALRPLDGANPTGRILFLLTITVGLPYLMLSTTGPLVQAWFARTYANARVYRLYSLSNLASMLALLGYPLLVEPHAATAQQSIGWSAGYAIFALLAVAAAWRSARPVAPNPAPPAPVAVDAVDDLAGAEYPPLAAAGATSPVKWLSLQWLVLATLGSVLMLALTTHLSQNIASIPFLWVLPLSLYLLSFILCFDGKGLYWRRFYPAATAIFAAVMTAALSYRPADDKWGLERGIVHIHYALPLYALGLFAICMFLHGELVERKPAPQLLTRFYLIVSLGGALGGILVGVVAPLIFDGYWEAPLGLTAVAACVAWFSPRRWQKVIGAIAALVCLGLTIDFGKHMHKDVVEITRNFYGSMRVKSTGPVHKKNALMRLVHGVILHGEQFRDPARQRETTTYYGETSGVGRAILVKRALAQLPNTLQMLGMAPQPMAQVPQRVGLIGMGVGTLTAYGRKGDYYHVYELNAAVEVIARRHFTYLRDSPAKIEVTLGDARLSLERQPSQQFDVLAVDAFSSDSIPVHLLTRQALAVYRRHMAPGGAIAFHVSNRYVDLVPIVRELADQAGMTAWEIQDEPPESSDLTRTNWVIVTDNAQLLQAWEGEEIGKPAQLKADLQGWTDDYYNLVQVLK